MALKQSSNLNLTIDQQHELVLYMHRNGEIESIINEMFETALKTWACTIKVGFFQTVTSINAEKVKAFRIPACKDCVGKFLFCLDEVQSLLGKVPNIFISKDNYRRNGSLDKGIVYGVICCMSDFSHENGVMMYMNGTNFSISEAIARKEDCSNSELLGNVLCPIRKYY